MHAQGSVRLTSDSLAAEGPSEPAATGSAALTALDTEASTLVLVLLLVVDVAVREVITTSSVSCPNVATIATACKQWHKNTLRPQSQQRRTCLLRHNETVMLAVITELIMHDWEASRLHLL